MRISRGWAIGAVIVIALFVAVFLTQQNPQSTDHSSNSDTATGTSALVLFAESLGHPTTQVAGGYDLPALGGLMFVFSPANAFTGDEAQRTVQWVHDGGVLVYANENGDPLLDAALGIQRLHGSVVDDTLTPSGPVAVGVSTVQSSGSALAQPYALGGAQVAVLRNGTFAVAYLQRIGSGTVVVMADPLPLTNASLEKADNGRFAADLLGLAVDGAPIAFDEYHHGLNASALSPQSWVVTPWGAAVLWLVVAVFFGLILRGRRFGPLVPRRAEASRTEAEWAVAVGELLRRAGARAVTLGVLAAASERAVASRTGLPLQPRERFWQALWQRAPEVATELDSAERALYGSSGSERDLLAAAQRLHHVAYPVTQERRRARP